MVPHWDVVRPATYVLDGSALVPGWMQSAPVVVVHGWMRVLAVANPPSGALSRKGLP
jgi:hypothetical protein